MHFARRRDQPERAEAITRELFATLCDMCRLFGSPFAAARVNISDLNATDSEWSDLLQIRDGVAIDRDTEKARDRLKYDFEVVPASAAFRLQMVLENATKKDLQLLCVGLSEYVHGFGVVGGKRSRGLGVAKLEKLSVAALELVTEGVNEQPVEETAPAALEDVRRIWRWKPDPDVDYYYPSKHDWFDTPDSLGARIKDTKNVP